MVLEQLDSHMQKNEPGPLLHTIHTNKLKMDHKPKCKNYIYETLRRKHRSESLWPWIRQNLLGYDTKTQATTGHIMYDSIYMKYL